jgi:hypothetical protein
MDLHGGARRKERPQITFDAFSREWIYLIHEGAYGILRSAGWMGNRIVSTGRMTMIGKASNDQFSFVNEEQLPNGPCYIDE